jgi:hypothetical protein
MDDSELHELFDSENLLEEIELDKILETSDVVSNKVGTFATPSDSQEEKLLLQQLQDEIRLERKQTSSVGQDFQDRLQKLKDFRVAGRKPGPGGTIPKAVELSDLRDETFGWCCICSEDGQIICDGCDKDVYCMRCFKEGHQGDIEYRLHKYREFVR